MTKELSTKLNIKDMPVDINAKLGSDVRKNLSEVIELEFKNRINVDYQAKNKKKAEIVDSNKKRLKIDEMIKEFKQKADELKKLQNKIEQIGFRVDTGDYRSGHNKEIEEEINSLEKTSQEILTIKHKLQTRLMLSTTVGEATVIMHEILGNTLIPSLNQNAISFNGGK